MQNNLLTWAVIFLGGIIVLNVIIILQLIKLKKDVNIQNFPDERYWELKLKLHVLIITVTLVGSAIVFLGWNIKSQISMELKTEILEDTREEINTTKNSADSLRIHLNSLKDKINSFASSYSKINTQSEKTKYLLSDLNTKTQELEAEVQRRISDIKTLLKIYVVPDIRINLKDRKIKLYFKDMNPVNSSALPIFTKPPAVLTVGDYKAGIVITDLTKEYIELDCVRITYYNNKEPEYVSLSLWFVESEDN